MDYTPIYGGDGSDPNASFYHSLGVPGPGQYVTDPKTGKLTTMTATNSPGGAPGGGVTQIPGSPNTQLVTPDVNSFVPNYGKLSQDSSRNISSLLNPTDFSDVQRRAAEQAVGGGYSGSGFSDVNSLHMTEEERIRRFMLGEQALSGAVGRVQNPITIPGSRGPAGLLPGGSPAPAAPPGQFTPGVHGGLPGGGGGGASPLTSPNLSPVVMPGTSPAHNWLSDIISRYSPGGPSEEKPLYQTRSRDTSLGNEVNPITGMLDYNTDESGNAIIPGGGDGYDSPDADYLAGIY